MSSNFKGFPSLPRSNKTNNSGSTATKEVRPLTPPSPNPSTITILPTPPFPPSTSFPLSPPNLPPTCFLSNRAAERSLFLFSAAASVVTADGGGQARRPHAARVAANGEASPRSFSVSAAPTSDSHWPPTAAPLAAGRWLRRTTGCAAPTGVGTLMGVLGKSSEKLHVRGCTCADGFFFLKEPRAVDSPRISICDCPFRPSGAKRSSPVWGQQL